MMRSLAIALAIAGAGVIFILAEATRHPKPPETEEAATHVVTLGTGSRYATPSRVQTSNLLIVRGKLYLIDAGAGVTARLASSGIKPAEIGPIFITDHHDDHVGGLSHLVNSEWEWGKAAPVEIYGPPGTKSLIVDKTRFTASEHEVRWVNGHPISLRNLLDAHDVRGGIVFHDENVTVTALENLHPHFSEARPGELVQESFSYRFETPDRVVVFTGDCDPNSAFAEFVGGADLLVAEVTSLPDIKDSMIRSGMARASDLGAQQAFIRHMLAEHLTPDEAGKLAAEASVGEIVFTRLSPASGMNDYALYLTRTARSFFGRVVIAYDGMRL